MYDIPNDVVENIKSVVNNSDYFKGFYYPQSYINEKRINVIQGEKKYLNLSLGEIKVHTIPIKKDEIDNIQYEINTITSIEAPVEQWLKIGNIVVKMNNNIIEEVEIINLERIERKNWLDYFEYLLKKITEIAKNLGISKEQLLKNNLREKSYYADFEIEIALL